ncbi:putative spermidine/putrescine transport system permease protein [Aneurinibacillus soli]|uniref:Putative 2-aminoethylphosphonate transport system permease protein PhnV n=1 Tax=Aneurinibacillus soli TaxID=1500254 RepID=A0A0U4WGS4_9BACL|nr:ABC transporter permease subunit [Aneurinibacillus soli]PYE58165.1 putative spermidine/putrescine transport system permease protein [Aneurinibacillus soli]BAU27881.1 putative 2-aminoethylphosphonate transport system permease protein PhnV [Aneurinibacillus soli]
MKSSLTVHKIIVGLLIIYLLIPLLGTFLFSIAGRWDHTILPESFTIKWYIQLFQDERFFTAFEHTLFLIVMSVGLSTLIMLPTIFIISVYFRKWEGLLQATAMLPYGIPPIVGAVGLIKLYSDGPIQISGTPWILIGAYFVTILPFMYQGIRNSLRTINAVELVDAAELLGASKLQAFRTVVFPNILSGILVSTLLSVALLFSEFSFANLLVGGRFETLQIYLSNKLNTSGHLTSAIVITYYSVILLVTGTVLKLTFRDQKSPMLLNKKRAFSIFKKRSPEKITALEGEN